MKRIAFSRGRVSAALALLAILIFLVMAYLVANPGSVDKQLNYGDAQIFFSGSKQLVPTPGTCITVTWNVEGIKEVYLDDQGVVGSGQRDICIERDTRPALRVVLLDDSDHIIHLDITILVQQPAFWIAFVAAITMLIIAVYLAATRNSLQPSNRKWWKGLATGLALAVLGIGAALILLEIALRIYFGSFGTPQDRLLYTASADELQDALTKEGAIIPLPYVNYGLNPDYPGHDSMGYRGPEITLPKPEGTFRIVAMGDSTTYGLGVDWSKAYPAQLEDVLRTQYGYSNVEVINAGVIGYTSWETFVNLGLRVVELQPDMIIIYDGTNDVGVRTATPDCYQGDNPIRGLDPLKQVWGPETDAPSPSTLYRYLAYNLGWVANPLQVDQVYIRDSLCKRSDGLTEAQRVAANPPIYFRRNLRDSIAVAQANGIQVLLSTQSYYLKSSDVDLPQWRRDGLVEHNTIVGEVAQEMHVPFYDLMGNIAQNRDFWMSDGTHQTIVGAREQASEYAAYLVKNNLITPPAQTKPG